VPAASLVPVLFCRVELLIIVMLPIKTSAWNPGARHDLYVTGVNTISLVPRGMKSTAFGAPSSRHIS
jgi:hypothetical protein